MRIAKIEDQKFQVSYKTDWVNTFNSNSPLAEGTTFNAKGENAHVWARPIFGLYGDWKSNPDFADFFCDVSHKKTPYQRAVTWAEILEILEQAWDPNKETFDLNHSAFTQDGWVAQGAGFRTDELTNTTELLKTHYGVVSVASGFAWSTTGINMLPFVRAFKLEVPMLPEATQVALWAVYEELGLGGINELAVEFHGLIQTYSRDGKFGKKTFQGLSPELQEIWNDCLGYGGSNFLRAIWVKLLRSIDLKEEIVESEEVWENILMFAHIRALGQKIAKGAKLTKWQENKSYGELSPDILYFLACATRLMRDGAKGRLSIGEGEDSITGCLAAIKSNKIYQYVQKTKDWAFRNPMKRELNPAFFTLVETVDLLEQWQIQRHALLNREEE